MSLEQSTKSNFRTPQLGLVGVRLNAFSTLWVEPTTRDNIQAAFAEGAHAAFALQGVRAFSSPRWHAAVHESGHAVFSHARGDGVRSVRVLDKTSCYDEMFQERIPTWLGRTLYANDVDCALSPDSSAQERERILLSTLAGWGAEAALLGNEIRAGSSLDELILAGVLAGGVSKETGEGPLEVMMRCIAAIINFCKHHEPLIRKIATCLMHNRTLRGERLQRLLGSYKAPAEVLSAAP